MDTKNLPSSKTIACEDHLIIWFWETYMHNKGLEQSTILIELMNLGDLLVKIRQRQPGFLLKSSSSALVCEAVNQTLITGDVFYHKNKHFIHEIQLLIDSNAVSTAMKRCL
ncbi:hypothetical protein [Vibrio hepatarius]|uniref:hypothetical protein n=1 Tax=Vibrio hepatarius TaxID=171383 RepID=UPI001C09A99F|nr:hypothetical protein [Vibrio hepatarius]MBU2898885.1 hypothetical protein [Vibrio hepatarius]